MQKALGIHNSNRLDCEYLIDYFLGNQDILNRMPSGTSNINNKTVVNYAFPITREIVGYTFGSPTEFIPKDMEYQEDVSKLSDIYNYEDNTVGFKVNENYLGGDWTNVIILAIILIFFSGVAWYIIKNRKNLFKKSFKEEDIQKLTNANELKEGLELNDA